MPIENNNSYLTGPDVTEGMILKILQENNFAPNDTISRLMVAKAYKIREKRFFYLVEKLNKLGCIEWPRVTAKGLLCLEKTSCDGNINPMAFTPAFTSKSQKRKRDFAKILKHLDEVKYTQLSPPYQDMAAALNMEYQRLHYVMAQLFRFQYLKWPHVTDLGRKTYLKPIQTEDRVPVTPDPVSDPRMKISFLLS